MIIKLFTGPLNYDVDALYEREDPEFIIGVDQACKILMDKGIPIDVALGDFDSLDEGLLEKVTQYSRSIKQFDTIKDYTDTFLAVDYALTYPHDEIIIYGGLGKRIDHTLANINLLKMGNIKIIDDHTKMYILEPGSYYIENKYDYISFFAVEDVLGLTLKGFKYELNNISLEVDDPLCISNEAEGMLSFVSGMLLVIHQNE
jgi:thiamine pyrophosphokinase